MFESAKEKSEAAVGGRKKEGKLWSVRQTMPAVNLMAPPSAGRRGVKRLNFLLSSLAKRYRPFTMYPNSDASYTLPFQGNNPALIMSFKSILLCGRHMWVAQGRIRQKSLFLPSLPPSSQNVSWRRRRRQFIS